MKRTVITLSIDPEVLNKIRELAAKDERSISRYVELILKEAVNKETER